MKSRFYLPVCFALLLLFFCPIRAHAADTTLTLLYTGETHSLLYPCDCPISADGGVARRAQAIAEIRKSAGEALLLDVGGVFAGGPFDDQVEGEELDRIRTEYNMKSMALMKYDAMAIGDEELRFGLDYLREMEKLSGFPFLSANLVTAKDGKPVGKAYVIKEIQGVKCAIVGLTPTDLLTGDFADGAAGLAVSDPEASLRNALKSLPEHDVIIALSNIGEENTRILMSKFPEVSIFINGQRKTQVSSYEKKGSQFLLQFNYQGHSLIRFDFSLKDGGIDEYKFTDIPLNSKVEDNSEIAALVKEYEKRAAPLRKDIAAVAVDLYTMSLCPYGTRAESVFRKLSKSFGDKIEMNFFFIADETDGGMFRSLHGAPEVEENIRQICIDEYYDRDTFWNYLSCINEKIAAGKLDWEACASASKIDVETIRNCATGEEGQTLFSRNIARANWMRVSASPTVYLNHRKYRGAMDEIQLEKAICEKYPEGNRPAACKTVPDCITDADCFKPKFLSTCKNAGQRKAKCVYTKAVPVDLIALTTRDALDPDVLAGVIHSTVRLFPGVEVRYVFEDEPEGRDLINKYGVTYLPAFIFSDSVKKTAKFHDMQGGFAAKEGKYILNPDAIGANIRIFREAIPNKADVFYEPYSETAYPALIDALRMIAKSDWNLDFSIHINFYRDKQGKITARRGLAELEEGKRQLVIREYYPDKFAAYLTAASKQIGSSYWDKPVREAGLDPEKIRELASSELADRLVATEIAIAEGANIGGEIGFLFRNREQVRVDNPDQFKQIIEQMLTRKSGDETATPEKPAENP